MLLEIIILIICICILLLLIKKQNNNKHIFHKTTKKYIKNILPKDILISSRPIIKEKLVWVSPPIKYHNIRKDKGRIKEHNKIRDHKLYNNVVNEKEFKKRISYLDNKYTGNNIIIDKDFNKNFEEKVKKDFGKKYNEKIIDNKNDLKPSFNSEKNTKINHNNKPSFNQKYNNNSFKLNKEHFTKKLNKPLNKPKIEHFDSYGYGSMIQHPKKNCPKLNMTQCLKFQNCGYITTYDFNNRCVPGDPHGPLDKKIKYQKYYHNDPFTRALIANDNHYRDMSEDVFDIE